MTTISDDSPYSSQHQFKILHDYYDVDCKPNGFNKEGVPLLKIKNIKKMRNGPRQNFGYATQKNFFQNQKPLINMQPDLDNSSNHPGLEGISQLSELYNINKQFIMNAAASVKSNENASFGGVP